MVALPDTDEETPMSKIPEKPRVWLQVWLAVVGVLCVPSMLALIWAGGMGQRVESLERQRQVDRQEVREDLKGIRDDVKEIRRIVEDKHPR